MPKYIYTVGFTKRNAEQFFETLKQSHVAHLLDIRLNNTSQLTGFTKKTDLPYFLDTIACIKYHYIPELAPDEAILREYRISKDWQRYESAYNNLLNSRQPEKFVPQIWLEEGAVLLCSEYDAQYCHRRLAAEYLSKKYTGDFNVIHL